MGERSIPLTAMPETPSSHRQRKTILPTPLIADIIFSERVVNQTRAIPAYGTLHPNAARWPKHKFVFARERDEPGAQDVFDYFYAADREDQDEYNFSFTMADIGGTKFSAVSRTYVTLRADFTPLDPTMGDAMPDVPEDLFTGEYVLAEKKETRIGDQELDSLYVAEVHVYVKRCEITLLGVDILNGKLLSSTSNLYYSTEAVPGTSPALSAEDLFDDTDNTFWGVQSDGTQNTGRQLSCEWYEVINETVIAGDLLEDDVLLIGEWETNDNFYWPAVLESYGLKQWQRRDGGIDYYPFVRFDPDEYSGPCRCVVRRTWSKEAVDIPAVIPMQPTAVHYGSPFFNLSIPSCLHNVVTAICDIGNTDPIYDQNVLSGEEFAATNYVSRPTSITGSDTQEPYRGGFLRTKRTFYDPAQ